MMNQTPPPRPAPAILIRREYRPNGWFECYRIKQASGTIVFCHNVAPRANAT